MGFDVEGARKEGYDDSQIAEFLAKENRFNLQGARKEGHSDSDIVGFLSGQAKAKEVPGNEGALDASRNVGKPDTTSFLDKAKGVGEAGLSILSGLTSGAVGQVGGTVGAIAGQVATGELGTPQGSARAAETAAGASQALTYEPRTDAGKSALETAGRAMDASKLAGVAPDLSVARAAKPAAAAAQQAGSRTVQAAGTVADKAVGSVAKALTPMPEPRVAALAKKATDLGIPLRPDQLSSNRVARMVGEALEKVPLSGSKADQRQVGFNKSLGKLIGAEESDRLTPDVFDRAMTKSGEKIGEIAAQTPIRADADFIAKLDARAAEVAKYETSDTGRIVKSYISDIKEAGGDGVIQGEKFRKINSKIDQRIRTTPDGDLRHALAELKSDLHDVLELNIASPEKLAELKEAKRQYAIGLTIEPLVAKATTTGNISPGGLLGRVTADKAGKRRMARAQGGELGDLAEIGRLFLKEPPSSGTAERALAYGAVGGAGYIEPHTAAGVYGAANVYNRAGPAMVKRALRETEQPKKETRAAKKKRVEEEKQFLLKDAISPPAAEPIPLRKAVGE